MAETVLSMVSGLLSDEPVLDAVVWLATSVIPLVLGTLVLGALYRFGTDGQISWRAVWPATFLTVVFLVASLWGYGKYVDVMGTSAAGIAGSAILLIVLVYLMAQVLLFGAEMIKVQMRRRYAGS